MSQPPAPLFAPVPHEIDFPADERRILAFWKERGIFERTLQGRDEAPTFVFYEGPPTANGLPHNGHVLTRVIKDLFPRYKTMRGYRVPRKAGWDTHGLPVEVEVEKELRIHGKAEIERYGVEPFTERCIESVFRYTSEWERLTERIGFWVDLPEAYVTYHRSYVESVWWALSELFRKGLLYRGHKIVWWWPQGGTALSSGEVGMGYRTVDDPSAYVAFPLRDAPDTALLIWTTTPWTLPSNMYAAVNPSVDYVTVDAGERKLIVAAALREELSKKLKKDLPVLQTHKGSELVGRRYLPPYDVYFQRAGNTELPLASGGTDSAAWRVIGADFVTLSSGTGVVHIAPAFGEDDYEALRRERTRFAHPDALEMFCAIREDGTFNEDLPHLTGRFVKDADKDIQRELKERGLLALVEQYRHDYPFCWRADDDPLIQFARPAWYIRTTSVKDKAIANNRAVNWVPEHIKEGRFGDFLANNVDWALSRERYWGTPLPLWVHSETGEVEAIPSLQALREKPGTNLPEVEAELEAFLTTRPNAASRAEHLIVHKPWIDKVHFEKPGVPGRFVRVPEVVDVWFDSGCMPFAQWGYPHAPGSHQKFSEAFPADFISEAVDQTRGWFYSLLMISTLVFDEQTQERQGIVPARGWPIPYKSCIVLGHVSDREGKKESKSKGNYTPPEIILDEVRMDFAVLDDKAAGIPGVAGEALIAREDLEGLDLQDGATVRLFRSDAPDKAVTLTIKAHKKLKRRVVLLSKKELDALGVAACARGVDVMPVEVPRLPLSERVVLQDLSSRSPGADAFRWFFFAASPTWSNTRHSLSNVRLLQKDFQVKLRNVYSFFTIYANIDGFSPAGGNPDATEAPWLAIRRSTGWREPRQRTVLDRWLLSEVQLAVRDVTAALEAYQVHEAAQRQVALVDALSNWYLRRSRERFWGPGFEQDKLDAYFTLYEALTTIVALSAPFIPFFTEEMWQNLVVRPWPSSQPSSVHLARYPEADLGLVDEALSTEMGAVRELVSLGLKVRMDNKLKVRQPLSRVDVILARPELRNRVVSHQALIADELNVHEVRFLEKDQEADTVRYKVRPNLRNMGSRLGSRLAAVRKAFDAADSRKLQRELSHEGKVALTVDGERMEFPSEEVEVLVEANPGYAAAGSSVGVAVLHTELTEALVDEGLVRELLARVQGARKDLALGYTDRIRLWVDGDDRVRRVTQDARESISRETLASELHVGPEGLLGDEEKLSINGLPARIRVERA